MSPNQRPLCARVQISLNRLGCDGVDVNDLGHGHIQLSGTLSNNGRALAVAAVRCVPGVQQITNEVKVT